MCGACIPPRGPGTGPGLTVVNWKRPVASVRHAAVALERRVDGFVCVSSGWA